MPRRARGIREDGLDGVTLSDLRMWMGEESHHVSKSSLARKTIAIRRFFAWALEHGVLTHNPASALKTPKLPQTLPAVLNEPQAGALMDEADAEAARRDDDPHARALALRDCAMLEVLYATGIRVAELVSMDLGSVHYGNRTIIVTGKGDKQRVVPFGVPAQHALEQWTEQGRPCLMTPRSGNALFLGARGARIDQRVVRGVVHREAARAGVPDISPHALRHSAATHMLDGERTCARCRRCWGIPHWRRRSATHMCRSSSSNRGTSRRSRARSALCVAASRWRNCEGSHWVNMVREDGCNRFQSIASRVVVPQKGSKQCAVLRLMMWNNDEDCVNKRIACARYCKRY